MKVMDEGRPELENIAVIGRFSDGKCRQIFLKRENEAYLIGLIEQVEGSVRVIDEVIESIQIDVRGRRADL